MGRSSQIFYLSFLTVFSLLVYFPGLGTRDFWAPVEPRYAEIARVMLARGEWLIPTINGDLYTDKPILYFWWVLLVSKLLGGVSEWSVRLPSALSAVGLVLTTYALGRDLLGPRQGFLGAVVLATAARVVWEGRWAHTDMPFTFFFTLALYFWARVIFRVGSPKELWVAYALMGLATLTKGLIGVVLPGLILLSFVAARRQWRSILEWRIPSGAGIFLLVVLPWFVQVSWATEGRWLKEFILVHHIQRYTAGAGHEQPFYYYLLNFPADFLPWTFFLLPAIAASLRARSVVREPMPLFLWLWFGVIFVFFSLSDTKRALYLLPLFPPAALGIGCYFAGLERGSRVEGALYRWAAHLLFNLLWIAGLSLPVAVWVFQPGALWLSLLPAAAMVGGGLVGLVAVLRRRPALVFFSAAFTVLLTMLFASLWIFPFLDQYKSPKGFAREVKRRVPPSEPLFVYADTMNDFNFYADREVIPVVSSPGEIETKMSQAGRAYLLIRERDLQRIKFVEGAKIVAEGPVGGKKWSLILLQRKG
ncbi:MAG: glycosyltransferase family 39 protein [Deltaproteobacteria bacterium]|nr:glycosyltransferase family 39 protein [Deltaproteobacteria bacterium]